MFGPPEDHPDKCNARLFLGDDWGDNRCTMKCQLPVGHGGRHREKFDRGEDGSPAPVEVLWLKDERFVCEHHGVQPDDRCSPCDDLPIQCPRHGLQASGHCNQCWEEPFACPDHGVGEQNLAFCAVESCVRSCEDDWVKVFPEENHNVHHGSPPDP